MADTLSLASALAAQKQQPNERPRPTSLLPTRIQTMSTEKNDLGMLEPKRRAGRNPFSSGQPVDDPTSQVSHWNPFRREAVQSASDPAGFEVIVSNMESYVDPIEILQIFKRRFASCSDVEKRTDYYYHGLRDSDEPLATYRVAFSDIQDQRRALAEMQGVFCGGRPMHVTLTEPDEKYFKRQDGFYQMHGQGKSGPNSAGGSPYHTIYVKTLGPEISENILLDLFQARFASCASAKIIFGQIDGSQSNYGLLRFTDKAEAQLALVEMQGVYCGNIPMSLSDDKPKKPAGWHQSIGRLNIPKSSDDLRAVLERLGVEMYLDQFRNEGFETWEQLLQITESDL
jgi:RNA recognition motif-containing protein